MVFIDTWHVYGQLKRELERFHAIANKYIVLHDTEVDGEYGESIRLNHDIHALSASSGFPTEEITRGLKPAVNQFLMTHPEWTMHAHFRNNNGLTILRRK
jgi:cephalosporin hydroxylase